MIQPFAYVLSINSHVTIFDLDQTQLQKLAGRIWGLFCLRVATYEKVTWLNSQVTVNTEVAKTEITYKSPDSRGWVYRW